MATFHIIVIEEAFLKVFFYTAFCPKILWRKIDIQIKEGSFALFMWSKKIGSYVSYVVNYNISLNNHKTNYLALYLKS